MSFCNFRYNCLHIHLHIVVYILACNYSSKRNYSRFGIRWCNFLYNYNCNHFDIGLCKLLYTNHCIQKKRCVLYCLMLESLVELLINL